MNTETRDPGRIYITVTHRRVLKIYGPFADVKSARIAGYWLRGVKFRDANRNNKNQLFTWSTWTDSEIAGAIADPAQLNLKAVIVKAKAPVHRDWAPVANVKQKLIEDDYKRAFGEPI